MAIAVAALILMVAAYAQIHNIANVVDDPDLMFHIKCAQHADMGYYLNTVCKGQGY